MLLKMFSKFCFLSVYVIGSIHSSFFLVDYFVRFKNCLLFADRSTIGQCWSAFALQSSEISAAAAADTAESFDSVLQNTDFDARRNRRFAIQEEFQGRIGHRKNNMLMILLVTVMAFAMILIPMGFQFLALVGGKSLLLAKLALILSAIQGLKKFAMSGYNYGFYQLPQPPLPPQIHYGGGGGTGGGGLTHSYAQHYYDQRIDNPHNSGPLIHHPNPHHHHLLHQQPQQP